MAREFLLLQGLLSVSLVCSIFFFYYSLRRREKRGVTPLAVMFVGISLWILSDLVQTLTGPDPMAFGGIVIRFLGTEVTVIGCFIFGLEYTGREHLINRRTLALLSIKPVAFISLVISPARDAVFRANTDIDPAAYPKGYEFEGTALFFAHALYSWVLVFAVLALIGYMSVRASYGYRRQIVAIMFAISSPLLINVLFVTEVLPFDLTASSFLVTAVIFMYATFRLRFMDALPVARQRVLEEMEDMVIVLDENNNIITVNEAVRETFETDESLLGRSGADLFGVETLEELQTSPNEVPVSIDGTERYLDVNTSHLTDYRENLIAEVLVCRDVTEQRQREEKLRRREQELELLKDLQSRFLRHNLRNELNVVRTNAQLKLDDNDPEQEELQELITERTDQILDWSNKARTIERLLGLEETGVYDINAELEDIVAKMEQRHPAVTFETSYAAETSVETLPQIESALENVVDNAARYNTGSDSVVRIETTRTDGYVEVSVSDNGPGIDPAEIDAIREGTEDPLTHSSGLGLWLIYWVVEKSGGELTFDTDGDGTTVRMRFEAATDVTDSPALTQ